MCGMSVYVQKRAVLQCMRMGESTDDVDDDGSRADDNESKLELHMHIIQKMSERNIEAKVK